MCQINALQIEYNKEMREIVLNGPQAAKNLTLRGEVEMLWPRWAEGPLRDTR
jgi:hypothetical protein